jgi:membrane peptidoglycan carboxypeptidase
MKDHPQQPQDPRDGRAPRDPAAARSRNRAGKGAGKSGGKRAGRGRDGRTGRGRDGFTGSGRDGRTGNGRDSRLWAAGDGPARRPGHGKARTPGNSQARRPGNRRPKKPPRTGWRRLLPTWRGLFLTSVAGILLCAGLLALGYYLVDIPRANALATKQSNVFLYSDGSRLARDGEVDRENVTLRHVSQDAQHAVLAAEDRDFYSGSAVDPQAMLRGAWNTVTGKGTQSGSTITQQYVKNYYLGQERTVTRKAKEFFIAIKLDREKTKDQILQGYLNTSYFGRNTYGIQAAAQAYYGTTAADLDAAQGAYLAALLNAPSEYDVVAHPENRSAAEARWNYVLDGMVAEGWLGPTARGGLTFPVPRPEKTSADLAGQRGYIVQAVKDHLARNKVLDSQELQRGGYRITTTLRRPAQDALVGAVHDRLLAQLDPESRDTDGQVRAGGAAIDPANGEVVAMYGGTDYVKQFTNGATRRDYQTGSTFKPFVFTAAIEHGAVTQDGRRITPDTMYDGTSGRTVQGWSGTRYAPENEDGRDYGAISVKDATDKSVNAVYAQMATDVGPQNVQRTAVALGIPATTPDLTAGPSIALGTATAGVLDMAQAYATLADHGRYHPYTLVKKITREGDESVPLPHRVVVQAVSRRAADTTTSVLQGVVRGGTATAALGAGRPAAGKTGTAEEDTAAWFAGYTPDLVAVVSVMGQNLKTAAHVPLYGAMGLGRINGGGVPAEIWAQFTRDALQGQPVAGFDLDVEPGGGNNQLPTPVPGDTDGPDDGERDEGTGTDAGAGTGTGAGEGDGDGDGWEPAEGAGTGDTGGDGGGAVDDHVPPRGATGGSGPAGGWDDGVPPGSAVGEEPPGFSFPAPGVLPGFYG